MSEVELRLICENCGQEVTIYLDTLEPLFIHHEGCDRAVVKIRTDNPRKLSIVTGTT